MDLDDRLVLPRQLQLRRAAMVGAAKQYLKSQLLVECYVLLHIPHDDLYMVDTQQHVASLVFRWGQLDLRLSNIPFSLALWGVLQFLPLSPGRRGLGRGGVGALPSRL